MTREGGDKSLDITLNQRLLTVHMMEAIMLKRLPDKNAQREKRQIIPLSRDGRSPPSRAPL